MTAGLTGWHLVILLGVVVLLFGARKLPEMARSVGQSARIFKGEINGMAGDNRARTEQPHGRPQTAAEPQAQAAGPTEGLPAAAPKPSQPAPNATHTQGHIGHTRPAAHSLGA